jgi:hypothetical protein
LSNKKQGWTMHILAGATPKELALELGKDAWKGALVEHDKQLAWVLWHPKAALDAKTLDAITLRSVAAAKDAQWTKLDVSAGASGFAAVRAEWATVGKHRFVRAAAKGPGGNYFFMTLFSKNMPDAVLKTWLTGLKATK